MAIDDSLERVAANDDGDVYVDEPAENKIENDLPHADSEGEVNEVVGAALDDGLDDYQSGDDSGCDSDETDDEAANETYEFRKVVKVYAIKNAYILERMKNEKSRVTLRANTQLPIDVITSEPFRRYGITCCNQRLFRARNKALELLRQDHKASHNKLLRYMRAILASNSGSTVSLDGDWLRGGVDP
ncbi:hypothetical protein WN943_023203 [Citrus x changshan-huyou]